EGEKVYVIPIQGTIEPGLARFVTRGFDVAEEAGARAVILEVSTPGGVVDSAIAIKRRVWDSPLETIAFVRDHAWSAGALITLAARKVAMAPGSSIGSAEPRPLDEKVLSAWRAELEAAALRAGRDPRLAAGMADADLEIPGVKEKGKLLNLTWRRAVELGVADAAAADRDEVLAAFGLAGATVVEMKPTPGEAAARLVTNPVVGPVVLAIGLIGLLAEALTPGWGAPGIVGILSLALFFGGQIAAGATGWQVALLFLVGMVLLAIEAFVPGFGVFGFSGIACMVVSIYLAATTSAGGIQALLLAIVISAAFVVAFVRFAAKRGLWKRLALSSTMRGASARREQGGIPASLGLVGKRGVTLTPLRPAGIAEIEGRRVDVVASGEFIERGEAVVVTEETGPRIVVRRVQEHPSNHGGG
ncbi:MAG: nodulation protein NfeD, partial [Firmicutes bacterium]|nr:nodulation protein NfeD [Bacillota bacterium]